MDTIDRLRVLIPHWIEHNRQHRNEFERWMAELREAGREDLAGLMMEVMELSTSMDARLEKVLEAAGGPLDPPHGGHHHHHHGGA